MVDLEVLASIIGNLRGYLEKLRILAGWIPPATHLPIAAVRPPSPSPHSRNKHPHFAGG
jgi:hypothetical protein